MNELVKKQEPNLPQKSVAARAGTNPITIIPTIGGTAFVVVSIVQGSALWAVLGFLMLSGAFGLFVLLIILYKLGILYHKAEKFTQEKKVQFFGDTEIKLLNKKLKMADDNQSAKQLSRLEECYKNFTTRLDDRIGKSAEEYNQYLAPAEEMYDAAMRNLRAIGNLHDDIAVTKLHEAEKEYNGLRDTDVNESDFINLQKKRRVVEEAKSRIVELRKEVDIANTTLIEVANQLNDIVTDRDEVQKSVAVAVRKFNKAADLNRRINEKVKAAWENLA